MVAANDIVQDLVATLRGSGLFALVTLGGAGGTAVPRAAVHYEGQDFFPADDRTGGRFVRVRCRVTLHTRSGQSAEHTERDLNLSAEATGAILADPYRGGLCCDLPIGRATEVGRAEPSATPARPEVETSLSVRCHFEIPQEAP